STDSVPSNIEYTANGTYLISLTALDSLGSNSIALDSISTASSPVSDFDFQGTCFGDVTLFSDSSSIVNGVIVSRKWYFGDGDSPLLQTPVHTYPAAGPYDARLISIAASGCTDTLHR